MLSWVSDLEATSNKQLLAALELLSVVGPSFGRPLVDTVSGSKFGNLKELRPWSIGRTEKRVSSAFDPKREVTLLVAGSKAGKWER